MIIKENIENRNKAANTIEKVLKECKYEYSREGSSSSILLNYTFENEIIACYIDTNGELFKIDAQPKLSISPDDTQKLTEFIMLANKTLEIGHFVLGSHYAEHGGFRYMNSIYFNGFDLTQEIILNILNPSFEIIKQYLPGLKKVIEGTITPSEAVVNIALNKDLEFYNFIMDNDWDNKSKIGKISCFLKRGQLLEQLGNTKAALMDCNNGLALDKNNYEILCLRAQLKHKLSELKEALDDLNLAVQQHPYPYDALTLRALIRKETGDLTGASDDEERAFNIKWP